MKVRSAYAAVISIGTSLLLLSGIRGAQAAEIKIVSPGAYEDTEGEGSVGEGGSESPYRFQQVLPAADFAALGNQPHWLVDWTIRPDQSVTSPRTVHFPDTEVRLSTTQTGPGNLSLRFDDNLGANLVHWYRGPATFLADVGGTSPVPREFYNADRPAGVTPYLFDPSQGNLLLDLIVHQGGSTSTRGDKVPGIQTSLASSPFATHGVRQAASVFQFTFIPVTPGDYNRDTTVDAADYVVWRHGLGTTYTQTDYDAWRANFGQTIGSGAALPSADPLPIAVPEPSSWVLFCLGLIAVAAVRAV